MDDDSKYIGFPVWKTCIFLNVASCGMYIFVLFFLPVSIAIPFMAIELAVGIVGLLASLSSYRSLARVFVIVQTLLIIPAVISFCNLFAIYNDYDEMISVCWSWRDCTKNVSRNVKRIVHMHQRVVIAAMVSAVIGTILAIISIVGFRKLRRFQGKFVTVIHNTQIFESSPNKPTAPPDMLPSKSLRQTMETPPAPQPVYIVDPQKYNVVYQPYGFQEQFHSLAQTHPSSLEGQSAPPAYAKVYPSIEEHPPGYIP